MERSGNSSNSKPTTEHHGNLINALKSSSILKPLHVEVNNDSLWYHKRKILGPRKHSLIIVKYNASNLKYEGFIYDMKRRTEDLEIVPMKVHVSTANSKWQAFKQAETAMKERDKFCPIIDESALFSTDRDVASSSSSNNRSGLLLDTHYRITVVSEVFNRMSYLDRMSLVYRELSHSIVGTHNSPNSSSPFLCMPSRLKFASTLGDQASSWEIFWFVLHSGNFKTELNITALTPAQWRPEIYKPLISERLGKSHHELQALQINTMANASSQKVRLRKLTTEVAPKSYMVSGALTGANSSADNTMDINSALQHSQSLPTIKAISENNIDTSKDRNDTASTNIGNEAEEGQEVQTNECEEDDVAKSFLDDQVLEPLGTTTNKKGKKGKKKVMLGETLGLDASVSGIKYAKLGGIYGHFFNDLSEDVRAMVLERYKNNKELIRAFPIGSKEREEAEAQVKKDEDTFKPQTNLARMRKKIQDKAKLGEEDSGTNSQGEMRDDVLISNRKIELMALRLQRIRRMHQLYRARRLWWRREYATLAIQRFVRGKIARQFTAIYRRLQPIAAVRIQRFYRSFRVKKVLVTWWYLTRRLTRFVLPKIKRFIRNCFLWWISKRQISACTIQKYVRRRIARVKRLKMVGLRYLFRVVFPVAALHIQRWFRGHIGRKRFQRILVAKLVLFVDFPAALRIQRVFRGRRAKHVLQQLRYEFKMLLRIQAWAKRTVRRIWDKQLYIAQRIKHAATTIQRHYRGHYDRMIYRFLYHRYWYKHLFLPAVLQVQCQIRRYLAYRVVRDKLQHARAAKIIQRSYRYHVRYERTKIQRRQLKQSLLEKRAVVIQKHVRRFIAHRSYRQQLLAYKGKIILAAKVIMRAWRTYKMEQNYSFMLEETRKENERKTYEQLVVIINAVKVDIREAYTDLATTMKSRERYKDRVKQLDEYAAQASLRMENIKREMGKLTMDDFERGWAEALGQEYEYVIHQDQMAREEMRVIRAKMRALQEEILVLQLEIEESEMELDVLDQRCIELINAMRLRLIKDQEKKAVKNMRRLLYRERAHWRIRSNRTKKMLAARSSYHRLVQEAQERRSLAYATTVSYEKRERLRDYEKEDIAMRLDLEARNRDENARPTTYEVYAQPIQRTFDDAVQSNLSILRGVNMDERAAVLMRQYKAESNVQKLKQKGQFAALKPDFVSTGISK